MATEPAPAAAIERLAFKPADAAIMLGIGRARVFELLRTNELESVKYGRTRLISRRAIERFLRIDEGDQARNKAA